MLRKEIKDCKEQNGGFNQVSDNEELFWGHSGYFNTAQNEINLAVSPDLWHCGGGDWMLRKGIEGFEGPHGGLNQVSDNEKLFWGPSEYFNTG